MKHKLNDRQRKAIAYTLEHASLALQDYAELFPKVNKRTLQRDLKAMVDKSILVQKGAGPTAHYCLGMSK